MIFKISYKLLLLIIIATIIIIMAIINIFINSIIVVFITRHVSSAFIMFVIYSLIFVLLSLFSSSGSL